MIKKEALDVISKDIEWHQKHKTTKRRTLKYTWQIGFIEGMKQARLLIRKLKVLH